MVAGSTSGASASVAPRPARPVPRGTARAAEENDAGVQALPALTRGTTRTIAYWKGCSATSGCLGAGEIGRVNERPWRTPAGGQVANIGLALGSGIADDRVAGEPVVRDRSDQRLEKVRVTRGARRSSAAAIDDANGSRM